MKGIDPVASEEKNGLTAKVVLPLVYKVVDVASVEVSAVTTALVVVLFVTTRLDVTAFVVVAFVAVRLVNAARVATSDEMKLLVEVLLAIVALVAPKVVTK